MIVGGKRGGVVWTKAVHFPVTISGINITFKVYMYKVISCIAFTIQWCNTHSTDCGGGRIGGVVWTKATHLSVTISGNLSVQQKISI